MEPYGLLLLIGVLIFLPLLGAQFGLSLSFVRQSYAFASSLRTCACSQLAFGFRIDAMPNAELYTVFGDKIEFGAAADDIIFPRDLIVAPIVSADPYLNRLLVSYCEEAISACRRMLGAFKSRVENAIVPLLPHGKVNVNEVGRRLGVSPRTLARRLASDGQTFSKVLDRLRFDLAKRYLSEQNLPISQIAWLLEYREVASFSNAFKRWAGKTPRDARKA